MPVRIKNVCYSFVSILRDGDTSIFRGPEISSRRRYERRKVMIIHSNIATNERNETKRNLSRRYDNTPRESISPWTRYGRRCSPGIPR